MKMDAKQLFIVAPDRDCLRANKLSLFSGEPN